MRRRQFAAALGAMPFAGAVASPAGAQGDDWPSRTVRIVCPFTPGGSQDNIARRLGAKLGDYLGQSFVIDNRTGAGGSIAADNVAKSPPDGYSVLLGNIGSHALVPHLYARPAYNAFTDFETVVWIGTQPNLLCCNPSFPHDTIAKLVAAARKEPGKYQYGGSGIGTSPSLTMELFKQKTGADLTFISYRGASASTADVVAGHLPLCIANIDSLMGQVSAGKLKPDRHDRRPAFAGDAGHADLRRGGLSRPRRHLVVALGGADRHAGQGQGKAEGRHRARLEGTRRGREHAPRRLRARHHAAAGGRCFHQGRVQTLGRGHPCRGHQAGINT